METTIESNVRGAVDYLKITNDVATLKTYKEKYAYLHKLTKDGVICTYRPKYENKINLDDCSFSIMLYDTNERLIVK